MNDSTKTAVVTGGTGHVGRQVVGVFLKDGWHVVVPWRSRSSWDELCEQPELDGFEGQYSGREADLTDESDVAGVMEHACGLTGRIDALVNLIGMFKFGSRIWETDPDQWDNTLDVNLTSVFLCCKHAVPAMRERGGHIINTTSKAAIDLQAGAGAYAVSKSGIITLTETLREELKGTDLQVNAIMPGIIDTDVTRRLMSGGDPEKWVKPIQIAQTVLTICNGGLNGVSGSVLRMFGGL